MRVLTSIKYSLYQPDEQLHDARYGPLGPGDVGLVVAIYPKQQTSVEVRDPITGEKYKYTPAALALVPDDPAQRVDTMQRGRAVNVIKEFAARLEKQVCCRVHQHS